MIKRNPMIMLMVACGIAFFFILFVVNTKPTEEPSSQNTGEEVQSTHVETAPIEPITAVASEKQAQALQAFQDSPLDTLRTLNAAYEQSEADKAALAKALETTQQTMAAQNAQSSEEVDALKGQLSELTERLNESLSTIEDKVSQSRDALRDRQEPVRESMGTDYDELGLDSARQDGRLTTGTSRLGYADEGAGDSLIWTEPLDATQDEDGNWITPATHALTTAINDVKDGFDESGQSVTKKQGTPVYTLHRGAMLANAVSMTALMGRIPLNGQVTDPYPFSMIVGRENLLANGFTLPDVQGAIVTGTVTGDWSLSCVRGVVESMDFIRSDGSILSYPETEDAIDSDFDGSEVKTSDLGFLADPNGNPCLTGERISNAPEYLTTQGLLNASTAAANAAAIAQQTVSVDGSTTTSSMTGNAAKNAAAESAAAFTSTVSDFIQARMGSSFDIIYTPPGTAASIHLRQPITLRIPEEPVRVRYDAEPQGVTYALP
ncbi:TIGR03752 family integrating conjugative element protein [Vibrio parahaemolyticus]|uniref:TIGR03752 family integrating conjugative element protein n=1 Tax=Vibrio parahaemolyticus TaxID=670 RepID=UPI001D163762|nr:TIGR03752 family integrating conjugative element protein [Vibrio parahaemolyticus]MCR9727877.1 TIGR03752 family integrating conjugative element protein [Vibrio parahaemolyticus]MCR9750296.1 TIGR03752 family integrating conjugative element protein [Vibrio parahaemolyticus]MCR9784002.1 TIGR03752 family integrating conjugative element protein [Vibrio parahaemolyticus]MCR9859616.1 TIGR03752 family integrating conjugative element protein [Vibrio parahaemolyticus]MDG3418064.1 TIGR03752 family int